jgi:hypothetical protein
VLGLSVQVVHRTPNPTPEKTARIWAEESGGCTEAVVEEVVRWVMY